MLIITYVFCVITITAIYIPFVSKIEMPIILPDEFGNISNALFFRGINWSNIVQYIGYYGFGSSLFYTPVSLFCNSSTALYHGIIITNILLILFSHFILILITKRISNNMIFPLNILASTVGVIYTSYIAYALGGMYETAIVFVYILIAYSGIRLYETSQIKWAILLGVLLPYSLMIHLRLLAVFFTGLVMFFFVARKIQLNKKTIFIFAGVLLLGLFMLFIIKNILVTKVWLNSENSGGNSFGSINMSINFLLSENGLKKFVVIFAGQLFYMGSSTFLLGWVAIENGIKAIIKLAKKEETNTLDNISILTSLNYAVQILIVCMFFIDWKRMDQIFYGRYSEYNYAILIILGFYVLINHKTKIRELIFLTGSYCLAGFALNSYLKDLTLPSSPTCASVTSLYKYLDYSSNNYSGTSLDIKGIVFKSLIVALVVIIFALIKTKFFKFVSIIVVGFFTASNGLSYAADYIVPTSQIHYASKGVANYLEEINANSVNFLCDKKSINLNSVMVPELLQFALYDKSLNIIDYSEFDYMQKNVLTSQINVFDSKLFKAGYRPVYSVRNTIIWEKFDCSDENESYDINGVGFYSRNIAVADYEMGSIISDTTAGHLTFGPNSSFSAGIYDFTLDISLIDTQTENLGYFEVYGDGKVYYKKNLIKSEFDAGGNMISTMNIFIPENINSIQFRTFKNDSVVMKFNKLTISPSKNVEYNYSYDFRENNILCSDFSGAEQGGRWATSSEAKLLTFLPDKDTTATITFGYTLPFEQLGIDSYDVDILMNGNKVDTVTLLPGKDDTFVVPISDEFLDEGKNEMSFVGEFEWSPSDYGSSDNRTLSFSLESIKFEPAA